MKTEAQWPQSLLTFDLELEVPPRVTRARFASCSALILNYSDSSDAGSLNLKQLILNRSKAGLDDHKSLSDTQVMHSSGSSVLEIFYEELLL
jgi:hypothetical protein